MIEGVQSNQSIPSFFIRFEKLIGMLYCDKKIVIVARLNSIGVVCVNIIIVILKRNLLSSI